jgi:hypothetical protein
VDYNPIEDPVEGDDWALAVDLGGRALVIRSPSEIPGVVTELNRVFDQSERRTLTDLNSRAFQALCDGVARLLLAGPLSASWDLSRESERPGLRFGQHLYPEQIDRQTLMDTFSRVENRGVLVERLLSRYLREDPKGSTRGEAEKGRQNALAGMEVI